jgi:hypothetical protein
VQAEVLECDPLDRGDGGAGQAAAVLLAAHPVADVARLERAAHDGIQRDPADHRAALGRVQDDVRHVESLRFAFEDRLDDLALAALGVKLVAPHGFPRGHELAVFGCQLSESRGIFDGDMSGNVHRSTMPGRCKCFAAASGSRSSRSASGRPAGL